MIIFTGAPVMTMRLTKNPTGALGVVATTDTPDGASPPGNIGEAQDDATIAEKRLLLYANGQHINVLKHFVYVEYGCGKQLEVSTSINHDITISFSTPQVTQNPKI
jgi:hypothetical protein